MSYYLYYFDRLKHDENEYKKKQSDLKSTAKGYEKDKLTFDAAKKEKEKIEVNI